LKSIKVKNVVLVHGAWADGSAWSKVLPQLEAAGIKSVAVQLPLTSLTSGISRFVNVGRPATRKVGRRQNIGHVARSFVL
jgi:hypothetical protein